jgi:hypothetical protein
VWLLAVAGPRLGDGQRWDLHRAIATREKAKKLELSSVEELAIKWSSVGELIRNIQDMVDDDTWERIYDFSDMLEGFDLEDTEVEEAWESEVDQVKTDVETMMQRLEALETENARLRSRCGALLEQALEGSEHGDVSFRFEDGRSPFTGHRAVLCAASEEYAGMLRSGMVEEQEGVIGVPPGVSEAGYRGLLEWVYLGKGLFPCCAFLVILCLLFMSGWDGAFVGV